MSVESTTDGDVFLAYQLKPGQLVVMDSLGAHKVDGVRKLIEDTGASLCYLPPYSPDFNSIEKCRAQMKQERRALKVRSVITLQQALAEALAQLLPPLRLPSMIIMKMLQLAFQTHHDDGTRVGSGNGLALDSE